MSWCSNEILFYVSPTNTRANTRTSTPLHPPDTTVASSGGKQTQREQPRPAAVCSQEQHRSTKGLINVPMHHFHGSHLANYSRWQRLPWSHLWKYTDQDWPLGMQLILLLLKTWVFQWVQLRHCRCRLWSERRVKCLHSRFRKYRHPERRLHEAVACWCLSFSRGSSWKNHNWDFQVNTMVLHRFLSDHHQHMWVFLFWCLWMRDF